jgi:hypothetical protein
MLFKRFIQAVMMPAFVVGIQLFFKFLFEKENIGIGIPLAATAIAQIFPYIFNDNLIILKIFGLSTEFKATKNSLALNHTFQVQANKEQVSLLKNLTIFLFVIILSLFIITLGLGYKDGYGQYHNYTGMLSVLLSIGYLVFA